MPVVDGVRVTGLAETIRALDHVADDLQADVKQLFFVAAAMVAGRVRPPHRSGALAASVKATRTARGASVKAGGARVPYAPIIEFGWRRRNIVPQPFMARAFAGARDDVTRLLETGFSRLFDPVRGA